MLNIFFRPGTRKAAKEGWYSPLPNAIIEKDKAVFTLEQDKVVKGSGMRQWFWRIKRLQRCPEKLIEGLWEQWCKLNPGAAGDGN